ncbi:MAG: HAMP domain-containing sensor histidine kinase [Cytophagales bacterium]|nr:HAMP domain-containing sensor histidine kinase [Cytophagales bacterium]
MTQKYIPRNLISISLLAIMALGLILGNVVLSKNLASAREYRIQKVQDNTVREFRRIIQQFGLFVASTRSFMNQGNFPSQKDLFKYMKEASLGSELAGKYILSVMDSTHNFNYSFDHYRINPSDLVGRSLLDFTDSTALIKYRQVMMDDQLHLFKPHNLVEGKVGISINFRLLNGGLPVGYVIPIIDFKSALDEVYNQPFVEDFVFHFCTGTGIDFDREQVYDGSKVYHDRVDPLYYANFPLEQDDFVYSDFNIYGFDFRIGTAYKHQTPFNWIPFVSGVWFMILVILTIYINHQSALLETTNDELKIANAAKIKFFSILGHDVKSPLTQIHTILSVHRTGKVSTELVNTHLQQLSAATANTLKLVDHLLEWAQLNTEKEQPDIQKVDLLKVLERVVQLHQTAATLKEIDLRSELKSSMIIQGDGNMLETIFRNLVGNALKFTERKGAIVIRGTLENKQVVIEIIDSGVGMTPQQVSRIFEFNKEEHSRGTEGEKGTGFGMVLVKEYLDIHKGNIQIKSDKDVGSTFTITLPIERSN